MFNWNELIELHGLNPYFPGMSYNRRWLICMRFEGASYKNEICELAHELPGVCKLQ